MGVNTLFLRQVFSLNSAWLSGQSVRFRDLPRFSSFPSSENTSTYTMASFLCGCWGAEFSSLCQHRKYFPESYLQSHAWWHGLFQLICGGKMFSKL